jgi:hypothetical protein
LVIFLAFFAGAFFAFFAFLVAIDNLLKEFRCHSDSVLE